MTDAPLKTLYIDTGVGLAGGQTSLIETLKHLDTNRFQPVVASPEESRLRLKCRELGVSWLPLPTKSVHLSARRGSPTVAAVRDLISSLYAVGYLAVKIRTNGIAIVHANTFKGALVAGGACLITRRPMIFHDRTNIAHGALGRVVAFMASRIIVVSKAAGSKYGPRAARKLRLVYDGIDIDHFVPVGEAASGMTVGFLGRISEEKGLMSLVECAGSILASVPSARFLVGGEPFTPADASYLESVKVRILDLGLKDKFEFLGHVDDVRTLFGRIRVLTLPSKNEALGLVVLEAMAMQKPVVAFDIEGPREIISSNVDGVLVAPGDLTGFSDAVITLLRDEKLARCMGERGRVTVASKFSSVDSARRIGEVYREICRRLGES